jgi:hypothetical protein
LRTQGRDVIRATIDDFLFPRAQRYPRGEYSAEGCYFDTDDYDALNRALLDPLGPGGDRRFPIRGLRPQPGGLRQRLAGVGPPEALFLLEQAESARLGNAAASGVVRTHCGVDRQVDRCAGRRRVHRRGYRRPRGVQPAFCPVQASQRVLGRLALEDLRPPKHHRRPFHAIVLHHKTRDRP